MTSNRITPVCCGAAQGAKVSIYPLLATDAIFAQTTTAIAGYRYSQSCLCEQG
jgi:hypothetical protein